VCVDIGSASTRGISVPKRASRGGLRDVELALVLLDE